MKMGIIGTGYVGLVTGICFADIGHEVICIDKDKDKINKLKDGICTIYEPGLEALLLKNVGNKLHFTSEYKEGCKDRMVLFIGVGTPELEDGSACLDYVYEAVREIIDNINNDALIVIKSTVPIGTNEKIEEYINENNRSSYKIEVASNPEFLSQGSAINDTLNASRIVIGAESENAKNILIEVYKDFKSPMIITNRKSAEMIKYASNDFLALKLSFINEIANLCEIVGADIEEVTKGMSHDKRIGDKFLNAGIGYGGSCFPKDTKALHWLANDWGYELKTIKAAIEVNENQKLKLYREAKKKISSFKGIKVGILGVTFKPYTDDLREAPSLVNINRLLQDNANIYVYDPVALENLENIYEDRVSYKDNIDDTIDNADIVFIFTEWNEIKEYPLSKYKELMKEPIIYDGRNCYSIQEAKDLEIQYYSIGRK
ncbi:UDP-glucose 6-dehydrogenase YwqF [Clostridium puniceum]|uniref:UDP-glucose 6-dehydrogenase n=1 Tax=Clostridium puniceum TaxID=29367 RepID=A0A1S8TK17_9CLOT|nr:UDP-glucose/GDP-mannose dehydrogenase family protein [Clostridium puniceum]OOM77949.1 UDP-glucose 6-dehydrogenase YwqF [Clostridium puniceum]